MAIQFNSKSFAKFRATMGKFYNAEHSTKDRIGSLNDSINGSKASLDRNKADLEKLLNGDKSIHESEESLRQVIAQFEKQIEDYKTDRTNATKKKSLAEEDAKNMLTDALYNAYKLYIEAKGDGDADAYAQAIADWFMAVQTGDDKVQVYPSGCMGFIGLVGGMRDSRSQKTGNLRKAKTPATFKQEWLENLADNLKNAKVIDPYKYEYIPVRMRKKDK